MSQKTKNYSQFERGANEQDCNMCIYKVRGECTAKSCCCAIEKNFKIENGRIKSEPQWVKLASA